MLTKLDQPIVFALTITFIVIAMTWLLYMGAKALNWENVAKFVSGPGH